MSKLPENCQCKKCSHGFGCMVFGKKHVQKLLQKGLCKCLVCEMYASKTCPMMG